MSLPSQDNSSGPELIDAKDQIADATAPVNRPWFRRVWGMCFVPITGEGWAVFFFVFAIEITLMNYAGSPSWLGETAFVAVFIAFFAIAMWKMESPFYRE